LWRCSENAPGRPHLPTIRWYDAEGKEIFNNTKFKILNNGRVLLIENLMEEDEKPYKCVGENNRGVDEGVMTINVTCE
jgi:hypothetical protein